MAQAHGLALRKSVSPDIYLTGFMYVQACI